MEAGRSSDVYHSAVPLADAIFAVCQTWAQARSKDPKTKVGAAVFDPRTGGLFLGYNGFPAGIPDYKDRWDGPHKYEWVVHAEANAIRKALMALHDLSDCTLYCTHEPCLACVRDWILPSGVRTVVFRTKRPDPVRDRLLVESMERCQLTWTQYQPEDANA